VERRPRGPGARLGRSAGAPGKVRFAERRAERRKVAPKDELLREPVGKRSRARRAGGPRAGAASAEGVREASGRSGRRARRERVAGRRPARTAGSASRARAGRATASPASRRPRPTSLRQDPREIGLVEEDEPDGPGAVVEERLENREAGPPRPDDPGRQDRPGHRRCRRTGRQLPMAARFVRSSYGTGGGAAGRER